MPYLIHHTSELHTPRANNHLKLLSTADFKILYYLISYYVFTILILTFEIPLVYRVTGTLESIVFSHAVYFFWMIFGYVLFYTFKLKVKVSTLFRWSIFSKIILSLYVMFFYSRITSLGLLIPLFAIRGAGVALFAIGYHISFLDGFKDKQRDKFALVFYSIYTLLPVFLPILGGYIINNIAVSYFPVNTFLPNGYFPLFLFGAILGLVMLVFSPNVNLTGDFKGGIKKPIKFLFNKKLKYIRNYLMFSSYTLAMKGVIYGLLGFLILTNEFNLGVFSSVIALVGSIYFLVVNKIEKKYHVHRIKFFALGVLGDVVTQIVLFINTTFIGLLVRSISTTLLSPLKNVFGDNIIRHKYDAYSEEFEVTKSTFILFQELSYFIGRVFAFSTVLLFIAFVTRDVYTVFKYFIVIFIFLDILDYFLIKRVAKKEG